MKEIILLLLFFTFSNLYSQNYHYNKRIESITYTNSQGKNSSKIISSESGDFNLKFEKSSMNNEPLFTEYVNSIDVGYYVLIKKYNNKESRGKIYETGQYYSTDIKNGVTIYSSFNKDNIVIFKNDRIIEYIK